MKWCCGLFEGSYNNAGERGLSVLIAYDSLDKPEFIVQHRTASLEVTNFPVTDFPMAWVSEARIFHCPWCGVKLDMWYGKWVDELVREGLAIERFA